jgi:Flp pilus assembly protein CpaB
VSPIVPRRPGGPPTLLTLPAIVFAVVVSSVIILAALWGLGVLDLSKLRSTEPSTAGLVAIPTAARRVPAYTRLTRDHFWDPRTNRLTVVYLPPRAVTPEMLGKLSDVIGRVLGHEKAPGYVFTEGDFLPKGTREGVVAGIPAGKRAVRISADKVEGLYGLHPGDRFDLLATMPIDASRGGSAQAFNVAGAYGQQLALQARLTNWQKQATVRVMVQNGLIVEPMATRAVPTFQNSLTDGGVTRTRPVQEAVIAINPEDVARLTEAIAVEAKITAVPRSGRPDDVVDSRTPDLRPVSPFTSPGSEALSTFESGSAAAQDGRSFKVVETIMGQKRELTAVPRP